MEDSDKMEISTVMIGIGKDQTRSRSWFVFIVVFPAVMLGKH